MKTYNATYSTTVNLKEWIKTIEFSNVKSVLVQIFSGTDDENTLKEISNIISGIVINATIIGTRTAGEIINGTMLSDHIVISISTFYNTELNSCSFSSNNSHQLGQQVAQTIVQDDTKAIIIFANGLTCNGAEILRGFGSIVNKNIIIAGGLSGDNNKFKKTFMLHENQIIENGLVAVSLSSNDLSVFSDYNLALSPIGAPMIITKAKGNHVYEIDDKPIVETYRKYLGDSIVDNLPDSVMEFPLIFSNGDGIQIARSPTGIDNNSFTYTGDIEKGTRVRFGVASASKLEQATKKLYEETSQKQTEAIFVYSCTARKAFLGKEIEHELKPLNSLAPISGFFTYGEFYTQNDDYQLLNVTTTILGISESTTIRSKKSPKTLKTKRISLSTTALIHLVEKTITNLEQESQEKENYIAILNQYQNAMDDSFLISITNISGVITSANTVFCKLSGYTENELIGKSHNIIRHPDNPQALFKDLWSVIKAKKIWHGIIKNRAKNGHSYYTDATIFPLLDKNDQTTSYVAIRNDVTEVYHQRDKSEAILNSQDSIIFLLSKQADKIEIKEINQKFFEIFDYVDVYDFLTKHSCLSDLFIEKGNYISSKKGDVNWLNILLREPNKSHLVLLKDKHNTDRIFSLTAKEINLETQTFIICILTEVTELEQARITALAAEKAKSAFLSTVSHELKTPLNAIIGFSQILTRKNSMSIDDMKSYITEIQISGELLLSLVNNILDISKIESEHIRINKQEANINDLLNDAILTLQTSTNDKNIKIQRLNLNNDTLLIDTQLIKQVIINLLSNAIAFSPENSLISISISSNENWGKLSISNEGKGFSQEQISTIFDPFAQLLEHMDENIEGTKLGLSMSKKIIELHDGKILLKSEIGKGSCFSIYLPKNNNELKYELKEF